MKVKTPGSVEKDIGFAEKVATGERDACKLFVDQFTDWVLYRIRELMKTHCHYNAKDCVCCLLLIQKKRKTGTDAFPDRNQCDECMDSYIWFFEYLKGKAKSYKGINNCTLSTYIWSIINAHTTYIDWLRWKYGRVI